MSNTSAFRTPGDKKTIPVRRGRANNRVKQSALRAAAYPEDVGRTNGLTSSRFQEWPSATAGAPEGTDNNFPFIERVVEMAGDFGKIQATKTGNASLGIEGASAREESQHLESFFELGRKYFRVDSVLKPPLFLAPDVSPRRRRESDVTLFQCDRSSLRISLASTSRPAVISALD